VCEDAGIEGGIDGGIDAGIGGSEGGIDGGIEAGIDGGIEAGIDGGPCGPIGVRRCGSGAVCAGPPGAEGCHSYRITDTVPMFIDACATGTHVTDLTSSSTNANPRDDGHSSTALSLPFPFTFFATSTSSVWVDTNGYLTLGAPNTPTDGAWEPQDPNPLIAALWEDLALGPSPSSDLCVLSVGQAPNRRWAVEWLRARDLSATTSTLTFEVILSEGTNTIDLVYKTLDDVDCLAFDGSTVGICVQANPSVGPVRRLGFVSESVGVRFTPF
jgi:hypothetical protein